MMYFRNYSKWKTMTWSLRLYLCTIQYNSYKHISQSCLVQFMRCSHLPIDLKDILSCETLDNSNADAWCIRPDQYQLLNDLYWSDSSDNGSRYLIRFKARPQKHWTDIYLSHHSYWRFDWFWTLFLKQHNCILPDIVLVSCFPNSERSWSCVLSVLKHRTDGNISCQQLNNWHETWTLQINRHLNMLYIYSEVQKMKHFRLSTISMWLMNVTDQMFFFQEGFGSQIMLETLFHSFCHADNRIREETSLVHFWIPP